MPKLNIHPDAPTLLYDRPRCLQHGQSSTLLARTMATPRGKKRASTNVPEPRGRKRQRADPCSAAARKAIVNARNPLCSLPNDLLRLVLIRLDLRDHVRLAAVCKSLRAFAMGEHPPWHKSLWLVTTNSGEDHAKIVRRFLSRENHGYGLRPRSYRTWGAGTPRCLGCFGGWLAWEEPLPRRALHLSNRILGSWIRLPPRRKIKNVRKVVLSSDPASHDCVAAALHDRNHVALCRPHRDTSWVVLGLRRKKRVLDLAFQGCGSLKVAFADGLYDLDLNVWPPSLERFRLHMGISINLRFVSLLGCGDRILMVLGDYHTDLFRDQEEAVFYFCMWELRAAGLFRVMGFVNGGAVLINRILSVYVPRSELRSLGGEFPCHMNNVFQRNYGQATSLIRRQSSEFDIMYFHMFG